jgi:hypothetical protein
MISAVLPYVYRFIGVTITIGQEQEQPHSVTLSIDQQQEQRDGVTMSFDHQQEQSAQCDCPQCDYFRELEQQVILLLSSSSSAASSSSSYPHFVTCYVVQLFSI